MPQAARHADPIGHSPTMNWLLKGLLIGAAIAVVGVLVVGTGGLAAAAVIGGVAAAGAGVGELMSTMSFAPKEVVGALTVVALNVFINGLPAARAHLDFGECSKHPSPQALVATGSAKVFINGLPAARVDDKTICSAVITEGSPNVHIGGGTVQTDTINPENLVPTWVHVALFVVGAGAAVVLAGPLLAIGGLAGGILGGMGGGWVGGQVFGEGSDGQKWSMLGGSVLGGFLGVKAAPRLWTSPPKLPVPGSPDFIGPLTQLDNKILFGTNKPGTNNIIGGHSPDVLTSPNYQMDAIRVVNPDGTVSVTGFKGLITRKDGAVGFSKAKSQNTVAPPSWSNADVLNAGKVAGAKPGVVLRDVGGVKTTVHTATVKGVKWVVIKENGVVTSSFPTGGRPYP
jgi:uncharacterized Zn-binding protein involved in type VI secretion